MTKNQTTQSNSDAVPIPNKTTKESGEQTSWSPGDSVNKYVVTRNGIRVSDNEYFSSNDANALSEATFWRNVVSKHSDGTRIEIVLYDKRKHRIW